MFLSRRSPRLATFPALRPFPAAFRMFSEAFQSRSITKPHDGHEWVRTASDFGTNSPQLEQVCEVFLGSMVMFLQRGVVEHPLRLADCFQRPMLALRW